MEHVIHWLTHPPIGGSFFFYMMAALLALVCIVVIKGLRLLRSGVSRAFGSPKHQR